MTSVTRHRHDDVVGQPDRPPRRRRPGPSASPRSGAPSSIVSSALTGWKRNEYSWCTLRSTLSLTLLLSPPAAAARAAQQITTPSATVHSAIAPAQQVQQPEQQTPQGHPADQQQRRPRSRNRGRTGCRHLPSSRSSHSALIIPTPTVRVKTSASTTCPSAVRTMPATHVSTAGDAQAPSGDHPCGPPPSRGASSSSRPTRRAMRMTSLKPATTPEHGERHRAPRGRSRESWSRPLPMQVADDHRRRQDGGDHPGVAHAAEGGSLSVGHRISHRGSSRERADGCHGGRTQG